MIEPLLLSATRITTFAQQQQLTNASGFFFERAERLFLVTSRHVLMDQPSEHFPDRIEIELHTNPNNLTQSTGFSIPLYQQKQSIWRQGTDSAGEIDVAAIEIERTALPADTVYCAFTPDHLPDEQQQIDIGLVNVSGRIPNGVSRRASSLTRGAPRHQRLIICLEVSRPGLLFDRCTHPQRN